MKMYLWKSSKERSVSWDSSGLVFLGYGPFVCGKVKGQHKHEIGDTKVSSRQSNTHPALRVVKDHPLT